MEGEAPEEDEEVQALKTELEKAQIVKEKFKPAAVRIRKENVELRDVNIATTKALEQETKRAHREEHGRNKFSRRMCNFIRRFIKIVWLTLHKL